MIPARPSNRRATLVLLLVSLLLCVVIAEAALRAVWYRRGVPISDPGRILYAYYPPLAEIDADPPRRGDGVLDVLILAGSVFHRKHGEVEEQLTRQLALAGYRDVRIFNLGTPAHTSRDSRLKYEALGDARFDLVIFYHGINETRANNVPPEMFREDYSHYAWYDTVNRMAPYHGNSSFALPYTLRLVGLRIAQALSGRRYVPPHEPIEEWLVYGANARSVASFEDNLRAIVDEAERRGDPLLLMTFATHVPDDYSKEAFENESLDYVAYRFPLEFWGRAEDVVATVRAHNAVVRRLAERDGVLFVDQARLMGERGEDFDDPCHFSERGSERFVENLLAVAVPRLPPP